MAEIDAFLGRVVVVPVQRAMNIVEQDISAAILPPTREVDLRHWFRDDATMTYRRRDPFVPTQTDLAADGSFIASLSLVDAALALEAIGAQAALERLR